MTRWWWWWWGGLKRRHRRAWAQEGGGRLRRVTGLCALKLVDSGAQLGLVEVLLVAVGVMHHVEERRLVLRLGQPLGHAAVRRARWEDAQHALAHQLVTLLQPALVRVGHLLRRHLLSQARHQLAQRALEGPLVARVAVERVEHPLNPRRRVVKRPRPAVVAPARRLHPQPQRVVYKGPVAPAAPVDANRLLAHREARERAPVRLKRTVLLSRHLRRRLLARLCGLHLVLELARCAQLLGYVGPAVGQLARVCALLGRLDRRAEQIGVARADRRQQLLAHLAVPLATRLARAA
eukprot:2119205-Pleurochrysis_carterae.AAC.2